MVWGSFSRGLIEGCSLCLFVAFVPVSEKQLVGVKQIEAGVLASTLPCLFAPDWRDDLSALDVMLYCLRTVVKPACDAHSMSYVKVVRCG